nr:SLC13 family permease [Halobaculum salinum]
MSRRYLTVTGALVVTGVVAVLPLPALSATGQYALATMAFAAVLWVTGAIPLPVTALSIPLLLTAFGVFPTMTGALAAFADPVIFLLLGGFVLAEALRKYDIDRRIAYRLVESLGTSPRRLVLAVMVATASLSMLISNSATTAMMVPVALGIARQVHTDTVGDGCPPLRVWVHRRRTSKCQCFSGPPTRRASGASGRPSARHRTPSSSHSSPRNSATGSGSPSGSSSDCR